MPVARATHKVATVFGDEIAIRAQTLVHAAANLAEGMRDVSALATAGRASEEREQIVRSIQEGAHEWATEAAGSTGSTRWSRRMSCSTSSRSLTVLWTAPNSTTPSRWRRTSLT